ncbi:MULTISPECIES: type II and III secretion system protein family protein [unclassified Variovorax]|uniref:type II and III secretion system protein family protein n=1 Tax=unclassified Variovorax TaxID=663243 RepID=UPI00257531DD|nr:MULTISPECIES: type II and III secretion system protein family protein [unclassified Variovorax]MDM0087703.1 type II and III secretion system protein family protein [Variovorax sp. J22G40]MDM0144040.1 type II and III secretion system protein family protein [Variovorax sp. J2P1-31]
MFDQPPRATRHALLQTTLLALSLGAVTASPSLFAADATRPLTLVAGTHQELLMEKGVERIAIADEGVATVLVTRKTAGSTAARLLINGKAAGRTTLMVWEKGSNSATTYAIEVQRRIAILEGTLDSVPAQQQARDEFTASHADKAVLSDRSVVDVRSHTVQVDVKVVEFNKSMLKEVGINLSSYGPNSHGFSFSNTPASVLTDAFNLALGFGNANKGRGMTLTLSLLEGNGLARVLAEPTLVTTSGQSASFLSGGELPIPVPQGLGSTTIEYKPFGIGLTVTPTVLSNDRIVLKVAPEVSDIDYSNQVNLNGVPVPAISTRRADTTVELGDGESFIIGGLVSRNTTSKVDKVPWLGDIPVLGTVFRQSKYQMNEKELVIMVTPRLVKPIARGTDLSEQLPGSSEQRNGPVWRTMFLDPASRSALPGFSR